MKKDASTFPMGFFRLLITMTLSLALVDSSLAENQRRRTEIYAQTPTVRVVADTPLGRGVQLSIQEATHSYESEPMGIMESVQWLQIREHRVIAGGPSVGGNSFAVAVFDLRTSKWVDHFSARFPAPSPDGRYLAFVRRYPLHFLNGVEHQYRLYDFDATPQENRPYGLRDSSIATIPNDEDVGSPILTERDEHGHPRANVLVSSGSGPHLLSGLISWTADSRRFLFIDRQYKRHQIVVAQIQDRDRLPAWQLFSLPDAGPGCALALTVDGSCWDGDLDFVSINLEHDQRQAVLTIADRRAFPRGYRRLIPLQ